MTEYPTQEENRQAELDDLVLSLMHLVDDKWDNSLDLTPEDVLAALSIVRQSVKDTVKDARISEAVEDLLYDVFKDGRGTE